MKIIWIGHSCFKIEDNQYSIIIDPYKGVPGLQEIKEKANKILVTHGHSDHNAVDKVESEDDISNNFNIKTIVLNHDNQGGKVRGKNKGYIIENEKYKIAHLGDIGCELTSEEIKELKGLDVLLIPVGGTYTIDGKEAAKLIELLKPTIAIPMHYKDNKYGFGFEKLEDINIFINSVNEVKIMDENNIELNNLSFKINKLFMKNKTKIVILRPQNVKL